MSDPNRPPPVTGYPAPPPQNGTAYPYPAAQPQQQTHFNTYYPPPNPYTLPQQQRANFLRRIFAIFIGCIIITGTIVFIMWVILRPQVPRFRITSLSVSNFSASSNSLVSGNWDTQFIVRNPNSKITLYYDHIEAAVFYKAESIAETTVAPFVQGKKNETSFRAKFASVSAYVNGIANDRRIKGNTVAFNIRMVARVRFKAGSWWARRRVLRVYCPDLNVAFSNNATSSSSGSLTGAGVMNCRVGL